MKIFSQTTKHLSELSRLETFISTLIDHLKLFKIEFFKEEGENFYSYYI